MKSLLKLVRKLDDDELRHVSEAIDIELSRRMQGLAPAQFAGRSHHSIELSSRPISMVGSNPIEQKRAA